MPMIQFTTSADSVEVAPSTSVSADTALVDEDEEHEDVQGDEITGGEDKEESSNCTGVCKSDGRCSNEKCGSQCHLKLKGKPN